MHAFPKGGERPIVVLILFMLLAAAGLASAAEKAAEPASQAYDRAEALRLRDELHQWLLSEGVTAGLKKTLVARVSDSEARSVDQSDGQRPVRVGLTKAASAPVHFNGLRASRLKGRVIEQEHGALAGLEDGGFVYTMSVSSPGATAMRLHFSNFSLPPQTAVYVYNDTGGAFGPYTGRGPMNTGDFWSNTLSGDFMIVQLRHVGQATDEVLRRTGFTVSGVGHLRPVYTAGLCADNAKCVINAAGINEPAVTTAREAAGQMSWISGAFIYSCSGGLIADKDEQSTIPYFLTANHCLSRDKDARSLEVTFDYVAPISGTTCPDIDDFTNRTNGSSVVSTGKNADYTLLRLSQAPENVLYLGWNSTPIATTDGAILHRISHPSGAPQAYSKHRVDAFTGTCRSWPRGDRIYSLDVIGVTEGGSSGSPVVNYAGQVVGQLSGACGTQLSVDCNSTDTAGNPNNATVDGAFAAYFSTVAPWLDPSPGSCTPTALNCTDGTDNDCDNLVDQEDADECPPPPGGTGGKGDDCLSDSDCLSNSCSKGKPGTRVCN
jgi:lysyl endopeptidase